MGDNEFWGSTPAKIYALLDYHAKVENPSKEDIQKEKLKNAQVLTPEIFKQLGGTVKRK